MRFALSKIVWFVFLFILLGACSQGEPEVHFEDLPEGDPTRGEALFSRAINGEQACITCHALSLADITGPGIQGFSQRAGGRVEGQRAEEYAYMSIVRPSEHVVSNFPNSMPIKYEEKLSPQQIADLIAFLLQQ